jgi:hypothetical protein
LLRYELVEFDYGSAAKRRRVVVMHFVAPLD